TSVSISDLMPLTSFMNLMRILDVFCCFIAGRVPLLRSRRSQYGAPHGRSPFHSIADVRAVADRALGGSTRLCANESTIADAAAASPVQTVARVGSRRHRR